MTPVQKYESTKNQIVNNLKKKDYWPEGMEHPSNYRTFYWTDDMAFCGFATQDHQQKTINMIQSALNPSPKNDIIEAKKAKMLQNASKNPQSISKLAKLMSQKRRNIKA